VIKVAKKLGFEFSRQAGSSHAVYKRAADRRRVIVPVHSGKEIKRKTLAAICDQLGVDFEHFRALG